MDKLFSTSHRAVIPAILLIVLVSYLQLPFAAGKADSPLVSRPRRRDIGDDEIKIRTVAVIFGSLIGFFLIMGCVSIVLTRHCVRRQLALTATLESHGVPAPTHRRPRLRRFRRFPTGLDPSIIDTFPTFVYSEVNSVVKMDGMLLECAVCLSKFENAETLQLLPKCCHVFHPDCIEKWLSIRVTCPVCRSNLAHNYKPDDRLILVSREPGPQPACSVGVNDSVVVDVRSGDHVISIVHLTLGRLERD